MSFLESFFWDTLDSSNALYIQYVLFNNIVINTSVFLVCHNKVLEIVEGERYEAIVTI